MPKPLLTYDGNCPVCTNYIRLIKKKITSDQLDFHATGGNLDDFQYTTAKGIILNGNDAITQFAKDFPTVLDYVWMLPSKYKISGLKTAYNVASTVRKAIKRVRGGCNCGKRK